MDDKQKIAQIDGNVVRYQLTDHLGSASLELNPNAEIISYEEYYPFGSTSYRSGTSETEVSQKRYKYVMKELDNESGLYYYGMRYYAAWICRFVSVDPLQHKYPYYTPFQYAGNKPITFIDLDGAEEVEVTNNIKTNIIIILRDQLMIAGKAEKYTYEPKYWKIIWADDITDAQKSLKEYLGINKAKNVILASHSISNNDQGMGIQVDYSPYKNITQDDIEGWNLVQKNGTLPEIYDFMTKGVYGKDIEEVQALRDISLMIEENGNFFFTACWAGTNYELSDKLKYLTDNRINIYLNQDKTTLTRTYNDYSMKTFGFTLIGSLSNCEFGWTKTPVNEKTYKISEKEGIKGKLIIIDNPDKPFKFE